MDDTFRVEGEGESGEMQTVVCLSYVEVPSLHTLPNTWDVADVMMNHSSISPYS